MKTFAITVAMDAERGIGRGNDLPWKISADMKRFKELTTTEYEKGKLNVVIMGRKTWESLPQKFRPLPGRINAVITANTEFDLPEGVLRFKSLVEAAGYFCADAEGVGGSIFVIGGACVFEEAIRSSLCAKLYITHVLGSHACDVFFPAIPDLFKEILKGPQKDESGEKFYFSEYIRSVPA